MTTANGSEHPRTFRAALRDVLAVVAVGAVVGPIWLAVTTLPVTGTIVLSDAVEIAILLPALFGVYLAGTLLGVNNLLSRTYADEELPTADLSPQQLLLVLLLMAVYINLQLLAALAGAVVAPTAATVVALLVPMVDKAMILTTGHSPLFVIIRALVAAFETIGIRGVDVDVVGKGSLLAAIS